MVNVLPPEDQKKLRRMYRGRLIVAAAFAFAGVGIIAFVTLIPSYIAITDQGKSLSSSSAPLPEGTTSVMLVGETRDLISVVSLTIATTTSAVDAIRLAVSMRPPGVVLDSLGYIRSTTASQIQLTGSAPSASDIEQYRTALVASGQFTQVNIPVASLAGTTNGRFSVSLSGAF